MSCSSTLSDPLIARLIKLHSREVAIEWTSVLLTASNDEYESLNTANRTPTVPKDVIVHQLAATPNPLLYRDEAEASPAALRGIPDHCESSEMMDGWAL